VSLPTGFDLPAAQIPLFLVNAAAIGTIWGTLRLISGSVIVTSLSHGLRNAGDYALVSSSPSSSGDGIGSRARGLRRMHEVGRGTTSPNRSLEEP
jgi:membrane protease YdiL (CAAX protease family)